MKKYFYPALVRRYGVISGPYVVQCDGCKCIAKGFEQFNEEMGYEAIRVIFRGRDENDPKVRAAVSESRAHRSLRRFQITLSAVTKCLKSVSRPSRRTLRAERESREH